MPLNSIEFVLFFAGFIVLWPLMRRGRTLRWGYLTVASLIFYGLGFTQDGLWMPVLALLVGVAMVNFVAGLLLAKVNRGRRAVVAVASVVTVVLLLGAKYTGFLSGSINAVLELVGLTARVPETIGGTVLRDFRIIGISFYALAAISYSVDAYRRQLTPTRNPLHFLAYLSMFPKLLMGPIARAGDVLAQLDRPQATDEAQRFDGLLLVVKGFFKKLVVADAIAPVVSTAFSAEVPLNSCSYWWTIMFLFAYQIYCDFSGYSDIARGLGKWMGYDLPVNFEHPYTAESFKNFWARWHMSLSTWFRDYVYIPLGGSRAGAVRGHLNVWVTMLLSGLWHGADLTFLAWGAAHAMFLSSERLTGWTKRLSTVPVVGRHLTVAAVFVLTMLAWVFFAAKSMPQAMQIFATMFNFTEWNRAAASGLLANTALNAAGVMLLRQLWFHFRLDQRHWTGKLSPRVVRVGLCVVVAVGIVACVFLRGPGTAFVYQF